MLQKYELFYQQLKYIILNSTLDIGMIYFILKNLFLEIESLYYQQLQKETEQSLEKIQKDEIS